jgi:hypothetical protein
VASTGRKKSSLKSVVGLDCDFYRVGNVPVRPPAGYHSTILEAGRDLFIAATHLDGERSREAQVAALEAIAQTVGRTYHDVDPRGDWVLPRAFGVDCAGYHLYDDNMILYEALNQYWGLWLYSQHKEGPDSIDERLARSVVGVVLACVSYCPNEDQGMNSVMAAISHCVYSPFPWLIRDALFDAYMDALDDVSKWPFQISEENVLLLLKEIDKIDESHRGLTAGQRKEMRRDLRSQWSFDEGLWHFGRPRTGFPGEQADQPDSDTSATPPWIPAAHGAPSFRQGEMLHAILGPALTEDLIQAVSASGMQEGTLVELTADLQELRVRKYSEMLLLMASAAHATGIAGGAVDKNDFPLLRAGHADAGKQFGWEVVEALRRFGVDPSGDRESYNRWLQYAVEDESVDLHWHLRHPDIEEEESGTEVSAEMEHRPRRKPQLMDYVNRAAARSARSLADRMRSRRRGSPPG